MIEGKLSHNELEELELFLDDFRDGIMSEYGYFVEEVVEKCERDCESGSNDGCILKDGRYEICELREIQDLMFSIEEKMKHIIDKHINEGD